MNFNERLIFLRKKSGLSQEALADIINVSRQSISNFESKVSFPNLSNLIELANYYNLTLDQLVYGDDCQNNVSVDVQSDSLVEFLVEAKQNTYAKKINQIESGIENKYCYEYSKDEYSYLDTYYGSSTFVGNEVVSHKNVPVFALNYSGRVVDENFNGNFLKESLLNVTCKLPYRGPSIYSKNDYTYVCHVDGEFEFFNGYEEIYYKDIKVYELYFNGAITI